MSRAAAHIAELLPLRPQGFLVEYGNPKGLDVDLFAGVNEPVIMSWVLGMIDMHVLPTEECRRLVKLLDPAVTEPLQHGHFVDGDRATYDEMQTVLRDAQPTYEAGTHLLRRSRAELGRASVWHAEFCSTPTARSAQGLLMALSYSISYSEGSRRVLNDSVLPRAFADLCMQHALLREIRAALRAARSADCLTVTEAQQFLVRTELAVAGIGIRGSLAEANSKEHAQCLIQ